MNFLDGTGVGGRLIELLDGGLHDSDDNGSSADSGSVEFGVL